MANSQKAKGNNFENDCIKAFNARGYTAARIRAGWEDDQGDLDVAELPEFVWQCKNYADVARGMREGVDGAQQQVEYANRTHAVTIVKRRLKPASEAYAVMPLDKFLKLIQDLSNDSEAK